MEPPGAVQGGGRVPRERIVGERFRNVRPGAGEDQPSGRSAGQHHPSGGVGPRLHQLFPQGRPRHGFGHHSVERQTFLQHYLFDFAFAILHFCDFTLASCLTHIRRGFIESINEAPSAPDGSSGISPIFYQLEGRLRQSKARPVLRESARASVAAPILRRLGKANHLFQASGRLLPKSDFGKALS